MKKLLIKFFATLVILSICACATYTEKRIRPCEKTKKQSTTVITNKAQQRHRLVNKKFTHNADIGTSAYCDGTESTGPEVSQ